MYACTYVGLGAGSAGGISRDSFLCNTLLLLSAGVGDNGMVVGDVVVATVVGSAAIGEDGNVAAVTVSQPAELLEPIERLVVVHS